MTHVYAEAAKSLKSAVDKVNTEKKQRQFKNCQINLSKTRTNLKIQLIIVLFFTKLYKIKVIS
jgi:hypothetical protein